jgi:hypothetical protein
VHDIAVGHDVVFADEEHPRQTVLERRSHHLERRDLLRCLLPAPALTVV